MNALWLVVGLVVGTCGGMALMGALVGRKLEDEWVRGYWAGSDAAKARYLGPG